MKMRLITISLLVLSWVGFVKLVLPWKVQDLIQNVQKDCSKKCEFSVENAQFSILNPKALTLEGFSFQGALPGMSVVVKVPKINIKVGLISLFSKQVHIYNARLVAPDIQLADTPRTRLPSLLGSRFQLDMISSEGGTFHYKQFNLPLTDGVINFKREDPNARPQLKWAALFGPAGGEIKVSAVLSSTELFSPSHINLMAQNVPAAMLTSDMKLLKSLPEQISKGLLVQNRQLEILPPLVQEIPIKAKKQKLQRKQSLRQNFNESIFDFMARGLLSVKE